MKHKRLLLAFTLILFFGFASPVFAQGPAGDQFVFGSNFTLEEGKTIQGNLVVFGGNVETQESSKIDGDLLIIGGNVRVYGSITGSINVLGGNVHLNDTAFVDGDVNVIGGHFSRDAGSVVGGQIESLDNLGDDRRTESLVPPVPSVPNRSNVPGSLIWFSRIVDIFEEATWNIGLILGLALVGWLVAAFLPEQMQTIGDTVVQAAPVSFGMGLLTAVLAAVLSIPLTLLIFTICLAIVPFAVYILLGIALLLGWIVIGQLVGERLLASSTDRPLPNLAIATVLGVIVLTVISNMPVIGIIPVVGPVFRFLGAILGLVVALTGLGAVMFTRYGTRPYRLNPGSLRPGSTASVPSTPPLPERGRDRTSTAEAELKAKIRAALAEADQADAPETTVEEADAAPDEDEPLP